MHIIQIGDVLISPDIFTEYFCCDLDACHGQCCVEGDAGAPITLDEMTDLEDVLPVVIDELDHTAQRLIKKQGVAYLDEEGDLVTSIVRGQDCVFTCHDKGCCLCTIDRANRQGRTQLQKPMSCFLYPIREKQLSNGTVALNYHRWSLCAPARKKGRQLQLRIYQFLKEPLIRRFGPQWYADLEQIAQQLIAEGYI